MAQKTGIIVKAGIIKSTLPMTGAVDTKNRLTLTTEGMGSITKNIIIVIGLHIEPIGTLLNTIKDTTEPQDTLLSIVISITGRFIDTIITAVK